MNKKQFEALKVNKPTHAYIGRKPCGCVVAACVDTGDKDTADDVAEFIKSGLTIERMAFGSPEYNAAVEHLGCIHKKVEPQISFDF